MLTFTLLAPAHPVNNRQEAKLYKIQEVFKEDKWHKHLTHRLQVISSEIMYTYTNIMKRSLSISMCEMVKLRNSPFKIHPRHAI
jgi:hypothetical protein